MPVFVEVIVLGHKERACYVPLLLERCGVDASVVVSYRDTSTYGNSPPVGSCCKFLLVAL